MRVVSETAIDQDDGRYSKIFDCYAIVHTVLGTRPSIANRDNYRVHSFRPGLKFGTIVLRLRDVPSGGMKEVGLGVGVLCLQFLLKRSQDGYGRTLVVGEQSDFLAGQSRQPRRDAPDRFGIDFGPGIENFELRE